MRSSLEDSSCLPPPPPPPPPYTDSNNINGKYYAHKDSEFNGGSIDIRMQKYINFPGRSSYKKKALNDAPLVAALDLRFKDISAAMKQGLYWSQDNVDPTGSCFYDDIELILPCLQELGFTHTRRYNLIDLAENPQWKGTLTVYTCGLKDLSKFRIHTMSVDNIVLATAFTGRNQRAYVYDPIDPEQNFNAIYDDMPLRGRWPWPKNAQI